MYLYGAGLVLWYLKGMGGEKGTNGTELHGVIIKGKQGGRIPKKKTRGVWDSYLQMAASWSLSTLYAGYTFNWPPYG